MNSFIFFLPGLYEKTSKNDVRSKVKSAAFAIITLFLFSAWAGHKPISPYFKIPAYQIKASETLQKTVKLDSVDLDLLEWAVFYETNLQRRRLGLLPLKYEFRLQEGARQHSNEMNALKYFDHTSPVKENKTVKERLENVGIKNGMGGENIALHPVTKKQQVEFRLPTGSNHRAVWRNAGLNYTYQEFAEELVRRWLNSKGHRFNILHRGYKFLGVGATPGEYNQTPVFFVTQNFSSTNY